MQQQSFGMSFSKYHRYLPESCFYQAPYCFVVGGKYVPPQLRGQPGMEEPYQGGPRFDGPPQQAPNPEDGRYYSCQALRIS